MAVGAERRGSGIGRMPGRGGAFGCRPRRGAHGWWSPTAAADSATCGSTSAAVFGFTAVERGRVHRASGYPDPVLIDGIPLRDRVWLATSAT